MPEQRMTYETSRAIRDAVAALAYAPGVPEPERRALSRLVGRRPEPADVALLRAIIRRHAPLLVPDLVATALGDAPSAEVAPDAPAPAPVEAPPPEQAPRKRGRPSTGKALSGAERARRWRQARAVADVQVPRKLAADLPAVAQARGWTVAMLIEAALDATAPACSAT